MSDGNGEIGKGLRTMSNWIPVLRGSCEMQVPKSRKTSLLRTDSLRRKGLAILFLGIFVCSSVSFAYKAAKPPMPKEMVGVWIGFDEDELEFNRLDLRADFTGYYARVSPADTVLHDYGVNGYLVPKWNMSNWTPSISLVPTDTKVESIYLRGRFSGFSLQLEVGGANGNWKRDGILYRESQIDGANRETKSKIKELEDRHEVPR